MSVHELFPVPVYCSKLERALTKEELKTFDEYRKETYENEGNRTSLNHHVLENKTLENLKKDLNKKIIDYFNKVVCTSNSVTPYITQSWLNYTEANQFHHRHSHSNSYVSGVFYINADRKVDQIKFYKMNRPVIELTADVLRPTPFNAPSWWHAVHTGDIILFPSTLIHGVDRKKETNTRISLSFNVFLRGKLGYTEQLTELILK